MLKSILLLLTVCYVLFLGNSTVLAAVKEPKGPCNPGDTCNKDSKGQTFACQPDFNSDGTPKLDAITNKRLYACLPAGIGSTFGTITPPSSIAQFLSGDQTGATAISKFLSNLVQLIYIFAAITLLFVLLWGAFDWITSEGDKEKVAAAQRKLINAIIGIMLFAVAFAILKVLGIFTGFTFFEGQNYTVTDRNSKGEIMRIQCTSGIHNGVPYVNSDGSPIKDPASWCQ